MVVSTRSPKPSDAPGSTAVSPDAAVMGCGRSGAPLSRAADGPPSRVDVISRPRAVQTVYTTA